MFRTLFLGKITPLRLLVQAHPFLVYVLEPIALQLLMILVVLMIRLL